MDSSMEKGASTETGTSSRPPWLTRSSSPKVGWPMKEGASESCVGETTSTAGRVWATPD